MSSNLERDSTGAPKAGAPSTKFQTQMSRLLKDKSKVQKLKDDGKTSVYYDHQSPAVRSRRKRAQQEFEWFVTTHLELETPDQNVIWNVHSFIELSKLYLSCVATWIQGKIGDKPKAGVLFQRKDAIYWWAIRKIDRFTEIYGKWHAELVGLITYTADLEGFEKGNFQKNLLDSADLALFFKALKTYTRGRENWRQNYVIWILVYLTGIRPGSFTVSKGYEKGAPLGDGSMHRTEDETLRWSDVEFRRTERGLVVRVTFRYLKGHRKSHDARQNTNAVKTWTFVPSTSSRYEFDLATLLTGLAFSRGLFVCSTLEELFNSEMVYPPLNDDVNKQPVFLQATNKDEKLQPIAMRLSSVNDKLQKICTDHGYYGRNTMYSFRRTSLIETKRKHGTEVAQETASHKPQGLSIYDYDTVGQGDIDWTADRLDQTGMSRKALRDLYSQASTAKLDIAPTGQVQTARSDQFSVRVDNMVFEDTTYLELERQLQEKLAAIAAHLEDDDSPRERRQVSQYLEMLEEEASVENATFTGELRELLRLRKNLKRKLRNKYAHVVKEKMLEEHKRSMKVAKEGARPKSDVKKDQRVDSRSIVDAADARITAEINALVTAVDSDDEGDGDGEVDEDALDDVEGRAMVNPEWSEMPDEVELDVDRGDDDDPSATDAGRLAFLRSWLQQISEQTSNLPCLECQLDDTVPQARKDERHTLYKLNRHVKSDYHSRMSQITRAFTIDAGAGREVKATCPLCDETVNKRYFEKHLQDKHPEQLEV